MPTASLEAVNELPHELLAAVARGEPMHRALPTLKQRIAAAIAAAPYFTPRLRRPKVKHDPRSPHYAVEKHDHAEMDPRLSPSLIKAAAPTLTEVDIVDELPHEFLARVGRGGPIDGYLPPLRLQRIAAAAAARYVPRRELEIDQRRQARRRPSRLTSRIRSVLSGPCRRFHAQRAQSRASIRRAVHRSRRRTRFQSKPSLHTLDAHKFAKRGRAT